MSVYEDSMNDVNNEGEEEEDKEEDDPWEDEEGDEDGGDDADDDEGDQGGGSADDENAEEEREDKAGENNAEGEGTAPETRAAFNALRSQFKSTQAFVHTLYGEKNLQVKVRMLVDASRELHAEYSANLEAESKGYLGMLAWAADRANGSSWSRPSPWWSRDSVINTQPTVCVWRRRFSVLCILSMGKTQSWARKLACWICTRGWCFHWLATGLGHSHSMVGASPGQLEGCFLRTPQSSSGVCTCWLNCQRQFWSWRAWPIIHLGNHRLESFSHQWARMSGSWPGKSWLQGCKRDGTHPQTLNCWIWHFHFSLDLTPQSSWRTRSIQWRMLPNGFLATIETWALLQSGPIVTPLHTRRNKGSLRFDWGKQIFRNTIRVASQTKLFYGPDLTTSRRIPSRILLSLDKPLPTSARLDTQIGRVPQLALSFSAQQTETFRGWMMHGQDRVTGHSYCWMKITQNFTFFQIFKAPKNVWCPKCFNFGLY